jgi:integrase
MRWEEVVDGDTWVIPPAKFKTGAEQAVPLSSMAKALLGPPQASGFVFSSDGGARAFGGFSKSKKALDAELDIPDWCHHDLRRSCRSLLSRAGVDPDTGERVLGHVIPGVRRTYDRFSYLGEKRSALEKLAALVERILQPGEAVVRFPAKSRGALATIAAAR